MGGVARVHDGGGDRLQSKAVQNASKDLSQVELSHVARKQDAGFAPKSLVVVDAELSGVASLDDVAALDGRLDAPVWAFGVPIPRPIGPSPITATRSSERGAARR
jgi:hypothetical protein